MNTEIKAKLDKAGSETALYEHFVFGTPGSPVCGGVYIRKDLAIKPDFVTLEVIRPKEG